MTRHLASEGVTLRNVLDYTLLLYYDGDNIDWQSTVFVLKEANMECTYDTMFTFRIQVYLVQRHIRGGTHMKIGLLGHGVVGSGVRQIIDGRGSEALRGLEVVKILVKDQSEICDPRMSWRAACPCGAAATRSAKARRPMRSRSWSILKNANVLKYPYHDELRVQEDAQLSAAGAL